MDTNVKTIYAIVLKIGEKIEAHPFTTNPNIYRVICPLGGVQLGDPIAAHLFPTDMTPEECTKAITKEVFADNNVYRRDYDGNCISH